MRIASTEGERKLSDLAGRVFQLKGARAAERAKEAEAALLEANPHLRNLSKLPAGTLLIVPEVAGVKASGEAPAVGQAARDLTGALKASLDGVEAVLEKAAVRQTESAAGQIKILRSREVKALAETDADVRKRVEAATRAAEEERAGAKELRKVQTDALTQLREDLEAFLELHS